MKKQKIKITNLDELLNLFSIPLRNHSRRVAVCSSIIIEQADDIFHSCDLPYTTNPASLAYFGGICHDVGKLLLPTLAANGSDQKQHPVLGAELLETYRKVLFDNETQADIVIDIVRHHHEQPNGGGFPDGTQCRGISLNIGICAVANTLDHFLYNTGKVSKKDYSDVLKNFESQTGKAYCESAVEYLTRAWPRLVEKYQEWNRNVI